MKLCSEVMIPLDRFPQLPYWFTLRQAMAEMDRDMTKPHCPCGVVLAFSAQNQLLGILRQEDILRGLKPDIVAEKARDHAEKLFDVNVDPNLYKFCSGERITSMLREQTERPIGDFARPIETTLNHDDDILLAIGLMIDRKLDFVPVLQEDRIVGILSTIDVLQVATRLLI